VFSIQTVVFQRKMCHCWYLCYWSTWRTFRAQYSISLYSRC